MESSGANGAASATMSNRSDHGKLLWNELRASLRAFYKEKQNNILNTTTIWVIL